ncbi:Nucleotide-binding universal stress protein, UspA family [Pricia antarctica]|uniref:Nucleotide-binding universal stress protein, UspA family n=1 Tax=Pricia antarctica TaxID=641691 RepID=A0A1G7C5U2_9FLAO|nr:universal stress protein [Pricia antarctica]SDE34742.1 Nucleotide-binding universal stress protein, UspA family [Pricia antarctica]
MKNILLPTDFSDNAWNAIFTAVKLYADVESRFYLLHAYEPNALNMLGRKDQKRLGTIYDSLSQYSEQELGRVLGYLIKNHGNPKHRFETVSKPNTLQDAILEVVSKQDIDLIVMGTQGATGAKQVFMGSNTVKVMKLVENCALLVVPSEYNFQTLKTVVFPTDFMKKYEKYQLSPLTELALLWKAEVKIMHVAVEYRFNDQQKLNQKLLKERFEGLALVFHNLDFEGDIAPTLQSFIKDAQIDLLSLVRYHHTFWEKFIGEPVVKKMAFHTEVPLLILPE